MQEDRGGRRRIPGWVLGCGGGCGLLVVLAVVLVAAFAYWLRGVAGGFEGAAETQVAIDERFGPAERFVPPADGSIAAERLEAFCAIRSETDEQRRAIADAFGVLRSISEEAREDSDTSWLRGIRTAGSAIRSGMGIAPRIGAFLEGRNAALIEHDMAPGEYAWIFVLAYYSWLGHSPSDAPSGARVDLDSDRLDEDALGKPVWLRPRTRREILAMLRNQRDAAEVEGLAPDWTGALEAEIEATESEPERIPWAGSLPASTVRSLEPFRDCLESTYRPEANPFELARIERRGSMSYAGD